MRGPALLAAAILAALAACGLEDPAAVLDEPGCVKDSECKRPRICEIRFGESSGTCQYPETEQPGGSGGSVGGSGGVGGTGGSGGSGGSAPAMCEAACEIVGPCLGIGSGDCLALCAAFNDRCRNCVVAACDAGEGDPIASCITSCT